MTKSLEQIDKSQKVERAWKTVPLDDLCEQIADCPHSTPLWTESGVIVLRNQNIRGGRLNLTSPSYTDEMHFEERSRRARLRAGDLVLTREAPMGEVCLVPEGLRCCLGQRMVMLRPNPEKGDPRYLLYAIQSDEVQHAIKMSEGTGATVSNLRIPHLKALPIPNPPIQTQKEIAKVLSSLDDKMELNRRMNATLEAMARALFKAWFVDFEPVHANLENRPSTSASPEIAKLFPSDFENGIPKGWAIRPLGEIADVNWGDTSVTKRSYVSEGFSAYSARGNDGFLPYFDFERTGVVVSAIGANSGLTWLARGKWSAIKNTITIFTADDAVSTEYLYLATTGKENWSLRGSAQPFLSQTDTKAKKILLPTNCLSKEFGRVAETFYERIESNDSENKCLSEIRHSLLPRLISGRISVQ